MNREEEARWLEARRSGIGGSEIAKLLGIVPPSWGTPIDIYLDKLGLVDQASREQAVSERMLWGKRVEPMVRAVYAEVAGVFVVEPPADILPMRHPRHEHVLASPDGFIYLPGSDPSGAPDELLEIKNISSFSPGWGEEFTDQIPEHYKAQAQWYLGVANEEWGIDFMRFAVLVDGCELRRYTVSYDAETAEDMYAVGERFWREHIEARVPPAIDASAEWATYFRSSYPEPAKGTKLSSTPELEALIAEFRAAKAGVAIEQEQLDIARNKLIEYLAMHEAEGARGSWGSISYATRKGSISYGKACKALGIAEELLEPFRGEPSRSLTVRLKNDASDEEQA